VGIKKQLEQLKDYLDKAAKAKKADCGRIDKVLAKLEEKEKKLKKKLEREKNAAKRKRLKTELKIIAVQRRKGVERREELKGKCDK
jgi:excinuclease UvrABC nuclease subunit